MSCPDRHTAALDDELQLQAYRFIFLRRSSSASLGGLVSNVPVGTAPAGS
jgi:hypothetical protein